MLSLVGLRGVGWLYVKVYPDVAGLPSLLLALRFFGAAAVLFVPTFLMGGTLPILARVVARNSDELGAGISQLYWVNTLGAVRRNVSMSGFILLPAVGLRGTIVIAVALNVLSGFVALQNSEKPGCIRKISRISEVVTPSPVSGPQPALTLLLFLFAVVGCTAFAYEIAWTRLLSITISSSTYAFTTMLATFLTGIVLGSASFTLFRSSLRKNLAGHLLQNANVDRCCGPFIPGSVPWATACRSLFTARHQPNLRWIAVGAIRHQRTDCLARRDDFWFRFSNGHCTIRWLSKRQQIQIPQSSDALTLQIPLAQSLALSLPASGWFRLSAAFA